MKFLLYSLKHSRGGMVLFWGPNGCGYTSDVDAAGRYTEAEARGICKAGETAVPIPETALDRFTFPRVINLDADPNGSTLAALTREGIDLLTRP